MLCLRRISLDAKSRLLFLSRSHSSTNDSMPKSTAISRLIHKKFLQQNGNNSPQAVFVFVQQRNLRTKAHALEQPVLEEKYKSAEDKDKGRKDKSGSTVLNNFGFGVFCACMMYAVSSFKEYYFVSRTKVPQDKDKSSDDLDISYAKDSGFKSGSAEKQMGRLETLLYWYIQNDFEVGLKIGVVLAVIMYHISKTKVPDRTSNKDKFFYDQNDADAKDSEFKFGFGRSGRKPKNEFEKYLYRTIQQGFKKQKEEEFVKFLRWLDPDKFARRVPLYSLASGVCDALLFYTVFRIFRPYSSYLKSINISRTFIAFFTVIPADSYTNTRAYMRTTYGHKCLGN